MKKATRLSIVLIGFTAMASQIVFARELLTIFHGNELSIGFILASWLIGGAIGSSLFGRAADRIGRKETAFAFCQLALAAAFPLTILAMRSIKILLGVTMGEVIPLFPMAASILVILSPVSALLGFVFALACRMYEPSSAMAAGATGRVYALEAAGAVAGGLLTSFVLVHLLDPLYTAGLLSMLTMVSAFSLHVSSKDGTARRLFFTALAVSAAITLSSLYPFWNESAISNFLMKRQWAGYELLASRNSIYGTIAVARREDQFSFFDNGLHLYTVPDKLTAEEAVHFALLEHLTPRDVLLVGGGVGGLIEEILKHPAVGRVDYVELDPLIIRMARDILPGDYQRALEDPRVSIQNLDGRFFIKTTDARYDCVIIHVGSPHTAQLNRYYTAEFFREVKRVLKDGGIVSFGVTSSENYINRELGLFLKSLYLTLNEAFADVKVIPGDTAHFLASDGEGALTYDYRTLMKRAEGRGLDLQYVREYYLFAKLSPQRISYMENIMKGRGETVGINHDFRPVAYYYDMLFWASYFRDSFFGAAFKFTAGGAIRIIAAGACLLIIAFGVILGRRRGFYKAAALTAVATTGFSEIAFQVVVLLSFQIVYGYLYYKLGLILTSFMIGLALGALIAIRCMPRLKDDRRAFVWTQGAICLYPLLLPPVFSALAGAKGGGLSWCGANVIFPGLPVIAGFIGGFQFPLANKICLDNEAERGRVAGLTYGLDLAGSALGALVVATFLVPVVGIPETCVLVAALNGAVLVLLLLSRR